MTNTFTVVAYCALACCCGRHADGYTASMTRPKQGRTCAAPRSIPFGTRLRIEGIGERIVEDRTAKKYDGVIDVYFRRHQDAKRFGLRRLKVEVVK